MPPSLVEKRGVAKSTMASLHKANWLVALLAFTMAASAQGEEERPPVRKKGLTPFSVADSV